MIKKKLLKNAKKVDRFLINFIKKQNYSLLVKPMKSVSYLGEKRLDQLFLILKYLILEKKFL